MSEKDEVLCVVTPYGTTPILSSVQVDARDICFTNPTVEHIHIDWRYAEFDGNEDYVPVGDLDEFLDVAIKKWDSKYDYERSFGPSKWIKAQPVIPFISRASGSYGMYIWKEMEKVNEVNGTVQNRALYTYLKLYSIYKGQRSMPLPEQMGCRKAYKGCEVCPHKQGLIIDGVCQGHGLRWKDGELDGSMFPLVTYFNAPNKFIIVTDGLTGKTSELEAKLGDRLHGIYEVDVLLEEGVEFPMDEVAGPEGAHVRNEQYTFDRNGKMLFYRVDDLIFFREMDRLRFSVSNCKGKGKERIIKNLYDIVKEAK